MNLSIVHRSTYIACDSPNLMQEEDLRKITKIHQFPFAKFLNSTHLKMKLSHFSSKYFNLYTKIANKWKYITFDIDSEPDYYSVYHPAAHQDLTQFTSQKCFNFNRVRYLGLSSTVMNIVRLLSKFPNLEYLHYHA